MGWIRGVMHWRSIGNAQWEVTLSCGHTRVVGFSDRKQPRLGCPACKELEADPEADREAIVADLPGAD